MKTKENFSPRLLLNLIICIVVYLGLRFIFHLLYADGDTEISVSINVFGIIVASLTAVMFMIKMIINYEIRNVLLSNLRLLIISIFACVYWVSDGALNEMPGLIPVVTTILFGLALIINVIDFLKTDRKSFNKDFIIRTIFETLLMIIMLVGFEMILAS